MPDFRRAAPPGSEDNGDVDHHRGEAPASRAIRILIVEDETFVAMYTEFDLDRRWTRRGRYSSGRRRSGREGG